MDFIIVTGMSGAGKTTAMTALEEIGYYCADNVPPNLVENFADLRNKAGGYGSKMAVGVDTRSPESFGDFEQTLADLSKKDIVFQILFLDASDNVLINRYKEYRRSHPLYLNGDKTLSEAIAEEREILEPFRNSANFYLDTTHYNSKRLSNQVVRFAEDSDKNIMQVQLMSFGFKHGPILEADLVFDIRFLPNPYYKLELRAKTGLDVEVRDYVFSFKEANNMLAKIVDIIQFTYPLYQKEGRGQLVVGIGCTGGQHRSVSFVYALNQLLESQQIPVVIYHRDTYINKRESS